VEILTSQQMREIDRRAIASFGIPEIVLMENAGLQVLNCLHRVYADLPLRRILLLCGPGNNGGDAFVVARHLHNRRIPFAAILFGRRSRIRGSAATNLRMLARVGVKPLEVTTRAGWTRARRLLHASDLVVDGVLGTGLSRPASGLLANVIEDINNADVEVMAVDIPSGLAGDSAEIPGPCLAADHTVTFVRPKIAHVFPPAEALCGEIHVADISIPAEAVARQRVNLSLIEGGELVPHLPLRRAATHKGDYGHIVALAGSRGKAGAARMVALGALRAGCALVTVAVPAGIQRGLTPRAMEAMSEGLAETTRGTLAWVALRDVLALLEGKTAAVIGPGLSDQPETVRLVREVVRRARLPLVIDADGLNAFAGEWRLLKRRPGRPLLLTPHPGEMARLLGLSTAQVQASRVEVTRSLAHDTGAHVVLKGYRTVIAAPDGRVRINPTGNAGMATGGSGDVLSGLLVGLLAQGIGVQEAAAIGVYLHGLAGDLAAEEIGEMPLMARDILARFPRALARIRPPGTSTGEIKETR
jgi:NAD(P)H-hydrate epimerase